MLPLQTSQSSTLDIVIPPMRASCGWLAGIDAQESMSNPFKCSPPRAVNRAPPKAYGIGICSVEEIGSPLPNQFPPILTLEG